MGLVSTKKMDIVYVLKPVFENEELRYSLRSLINLPHKNVYFIGGCPKWAKNIIHIGMIQDGNKWENVNKSLKKACCTNGLSKDFILMNDDFFIMKPIDGLQHHYYKELKDRVGDLSEEVFNPSRYMMNLNRANDILETNGLETKNYELHMPMILNKEKLFPILQEYPDTAARRSIYGNMYNVGGKEIEDCKIYGLMEVPIPHKKFISTTDASFRRGLVGVHLRNKFKEKSEYEI